MTGKNNLAIRGLMSSCTKAVIYGHRGQARGPGYKLDCPDIFYCTSQTFAMVQLLMNEMSSPVLHTSWYRKTYTR